MITTALTPKSVDWWPPHTPPSGILGAPFVFKVRNKISCGCPQPDHVYVFCIKKWNEN